MPDTDALRSQPKPSHLENTPGPRVLMRMARVVLALYYARIRQVPRRITRDIDDSFGDVHGARQSRLFNAYYDQYSFHPLVVFDADARAPDRPPERWADLNHGRSQLAAARPGRRPARHRSEYAPDGQAYRTSQEYRASHQGGTDQRRSPALIVAWRKAPSRGAPLGTSTARRPSCGLGNRWTRDPTTPPPAADLVPLLGGRNETVQPAGHLCCVVRRPDRSGPWG